MSVDNPKPVANHQPVANMEKRMAQVSPSRVADKIMIRLPDGMRDQIAQSARENHRSVNAEVVHHLSKIFSAPPVEQPGGQRVG